MYTGRNRPTSITDDQDAVRHMAELMTPGDHQNFRMSNSLIARAVPYTGTYTLTPTYPLALCLCETYHTQSPFAHSVYQGLNALFARLVRYQPMVFSSDHQTVWRDRGFSVHLFGLDQFDAPYTILSKTFWFRGFDKQRNIYPHGIEFLDRICLSCTLSRESAIFGKEPGPINETTDKWAVERLLKEQCFDKVVSEVILPWTTEENIRAHQLRYQFNTNAAKQRMVIPGQRGSWGSWGRTAWEPWEANGEFTLHFILDFAYDKSIRGPELTE